MEKIAVEFVYPRQQEMKTDDDVKIWVEVIIATLQYAVATVNVLMANSNDVNLANTLDNYEILVSFDRINKLDRDYSYWQILSLVCILKYHVI